MKRVLVITTSHGDIEGRPTTGVWFSEFSEPYDELTRAGLEITVASPRGGPSPVDPRGYPSREEIADVRDALARLNATLRLGNLDARNFDGIFIPGGHGPMFDLATDGDTKRLLAETWRLGRPIAAVCHGPAALLGVTLEGGATLLQGRHVTAFSRAEDAQDALFAHMPFALQERMQAEGALFSALPPRSVHVQTDGHLVTGQNPASARATAQAFVAQLLSAPDKGQTP